MTTNAPLLVLLHADNEHAAIARAKADAQADYDTVKVLGCSEGSSGVWTVRLAVGKAKAANSVPTPRQEPVALDPSTPAHATDN